MRLMLLVAALFLTACPSVGNKITKAQLERLQEVYKEDTKRCLCARGEAASNERCLPKVRIEAGERLFEEAIERVSTDE